VSIKNSKLLVLGASGHGSVVADAAMRTGQWSEVAFLDKKFPTLGQFGKWTVIDLDENLEKYREKYVNLVIAIGDNSVRLKWHSRAENAGFKLVSIVHPSASIGENVDIGAGSVLFAGSVINHGARIGRSCIVNTSASVDHDGVLEDGVHISPGAHLAGAVSVGECSWIGIGASVIQQVEIGKSVMVGAGAAVVDDVKDGVTVVGVPAKELK